MLTKFRAVLSNRSAQAGQNTQQVVIILACIAIIVVAVLFVAGHTT